jgi:hypothetical protein
VLGVFAAYKLGTLAGGKATGILSVIFLVLTPRYYGHAFNNSKDIPFAVGYLWSLYFIVRLLRELLRPTVLTVLSTGVAIGMSLGVRITGLLLLAYLFLMATIILIRLYRSGDDRPGVLPLLEQFTILCAVAYVTMFVFWPWAQAHPLGGPVDAFNVFTSFAEEHFTVFGGVYVSSLEIPREYALTWLSLTLPETTAIGLAFLVSGIIYRKRSDLAVRKSRPHWSAEQFWGRRRSRKRQSIRVSTPDCADEERSTGRIGSARLKTSKSEIWISIPPILT